MLALSLGNIISSSSTINPTHDVYHVSGSITIENITPPNPDFAGVIYLIPDDAGLSIDITGNIISPTPGQFFLGKNQLYSFFFDPVLGKWYFKA